MAASKYPQELYESPFYRIWANMKARCNYSNSKSYKHYGGRGIKVCKRWDKFSNFYEDMFSNYQNGLSLDRIDVNGDYTPKNCRWATKEEQMNNMNTNVIIEINNKKQTLSQWIKEVGLKSSTVRQRYYVYGWSAERSLFTPIRKWSKS